MNVSPAATFLHAEKPHINHGFPKFYMWKRRRTISDTLISLFMSVYLIKEADGVLLKIS